MKILHVLAPSPMGGLERVVQMLARAQGRVTNDIAVVGVVSSASASASFFDAFSGTGVDATPVVVPDRAWGRELRTLGSEIEARRPDVVHTHGYRADVLGGWAARRVGVPVVSTAHGFTGGGVKNRLYEWLQVASYRQGRTVIAVSMPLRGELERRGVPADRLHLVRNAWAADGVALEPAEARRALGIDENGAVVGWVGRLGHEKGPDVAVDAMRGVSGARLSIIGDGPMRDQLESLASHHGVNDRIGWLGMRPRADLHLRAFDVLVLSSRTEGTPIVVLEALAAGVPIVATRVGGVPDVVRNEQEALLVPPEDPVALARAVQRCLDDRPGARRRAERGRTRLDEEFGVEQWVARHAEIYGQAVKEEGA